MSDANLSARNSRNGEGDYPPPKTRTHEALVWVGNFVLWAILFATVSVGFLSLAGLWVTSAAQGASFFDPTGWAFIVASVLALVLYDFEYYIRGSLRESYDFEPSVWWFNFVAPVIAVVVWGLVFLVSSNPLVVRVPQGALLITNQHEILAPGETYQGSRTEITARRYPLASSVNSFPLRLPMSDSDYVVGTLSGSYEIAITPELREHVRQNPPDLNSREQEHYFDRMFVREFGAVFTELVREEANPGNTTVGDVNGWSRDSASVPMAVRIGLRVEETGHTFPSWFRNTELFHASVRNWNREQQE